MMTWLQIVINRAVIEVTLVGLNSWFSKCVMYSMLWGYKQLALHWARDVYKWNNCVCPAVITTI